MLLFIITDMSKRLIYVTSERWSHIVREHPLLFNKLEDIKDILVNPLVIKISHYDDNVRFYYKYYKSSKSNLIVVVKYLNGKGFIITSFYTNRIGG